MKTKHKTLTAFFFSLASLFLLASHVHAQGLTQNLLYYLPIIGNANDVSGNGYHATSNGVLVPDRLGVPNSAYSFNGVNQTIVLPNAAQLKPQLPMSVSFWAHYSVAGNTGFSNDFTPALYTGMWTGVGTDGMVNLAWGDGGTTTPAHRQAKNSAVPAGVGAWHHYVGVIRGVNDMDIYIDCEDAGGTYSGSGGPIYYDGNPGQIGLSAGANYPGGVVYMTGMVDEIAFWDRALTPADVVKICEGGLNQLITANDLPVAEDLQVHPNPAKDQMMVTLPASWTGEGLLQIMDLQGRMILRQTIEGNSQQVVDVSGFESGIYFLRLSSEAGLQMSKRISVL